MRVVKAIFGVKQIIDLGVEDLPGEMARLLQHCPAELRIGVIALHAGTVILTGTPEGVGMARKPPVWMKPGDTIVIDIEGIGTLENRVVAERV
jgi:2-keto-4-pentenoate hydratase/2-oxohepta-3-ene-1,7-dioic acid hydratase in catechol pathway